MIYADNAATTKVSKSVLKKMLPFLEECYGNASSYHSLGVDAKQAIERSRQQVAKAIGSSPNEVYFTSGGSEGNSWVLSSIRQFLSMDDAHIITSVIEHPSVLQVCQALEKEGVAVTYIPVDSNGCVSLDDVRAAIRPKTKLVSIMFANNEVGSIQPIAEIGTYLREKNILFHTDAVQAMGHVPIDVSELSVDFLTASSHKFNGPKGVGFLYARAGAPLEKLVFGGGQERGMRSGTENVAGIVATGYALEESVSTMFSTTNQLNVLTQATISGIRAKIPSAHVIDCGEKRLPGVVNIIFNNVSGDSLMHILDLKGICISTGSACASSNNEPSHVLKALGLSDKQAKSAIRISYGRYNNMQEVESIISAICFAHNKILGIAKNAPSITTAQEG